jgi:Tol biopolymer transport system component
LAEVPAPPVFFDPSFTWLPDGKWVVTDGLALLSTESGETRSLTSPPTKSFIDYSPAVSPDGRTVAFSRSASWFRSDIYLLDLTEDLKPKGEPRRLTSLKGDSTDSAWTPEGQEIIFSSAAEFDGGRLWRVPSSGSGVPEQLPFSGAGAYRPAISRNGNRLAYQRYMFDKNIWRLPLSSLATAAGPPARFIASTRQDFAPQYSPDGKRIAFVSDRNGVNGIWVSDVEGSNAVELFSRAGAECGQVVWSPDAQRLAIDSNVEGNFDIYVMGASGGRPMRLTTDSAGDISPSWSGDGNWVYFTSDRSGRHEVWKVPAGAGEAVQVTKNGGGLAFESSDGKLIYYTKDRPSSALWKMPVKGGEEILVLPSVYLENFFLIDEGIYFIPEPGADVKFSVQFLSLANGMVKTVTPISGQPFYGPTVSPDRRYLLYSQLDEAGSDLMLVENFR